MTKMSYEVSSSHVGAMPSKTTDNSFKSCLCTMLVVLAICILLVLLAFSYRRFGSQDEPYKAHTLQGQYNFKKTLSSTELPNNSRETKVTVTEDNRNVTIPEELDYGMNRSKDTIPTMPVTESNTKFEKIIGKELDTTTRNEQTSSEKQETTTGHQQKTTEKQEASTGNQQNITEKQETSTEQQKITVDKRMNETLQKSSPSEADHNSTKNNETTPRIPSEEETINSNPDHEEPFEVDGRVNSENPISTIEAQNICTSNKCSSTAARMLASMDLSKAPCENFYEYACGGGVPANEEEEFNLFSQEILESTDRPNFVEKFDIFYKSCLKHEDEFHYHERVEEAKALMRAIGSFQDEEQLDTINDLTKLVANLTLVKEMTLFDVEIDIDPANNTYILKLIKPVRTSLNMDHWLSEHKRKCIRNIEEGQMALSNNITEIHLNLLKCQQNYSDCVDSIENSMQELGLFSNLTKEERLNQSHRLSKIVESIQEYIINEEIISQIYEVKSLEELQKEFPQIMWKKLFSLISNIDVDDKTVVLLHTAYFKKVFELLDGPDIKYLSNALLAHTLYHNVVLPTHTHSRVKYCKEKSKELMPDILNYIYQKNIPDEGISESIGHVKEIYDILKGGFIDSLEYFDWLDEESKISIKKKVENLKLIFNSSSLINERMILEVTYANLSLRDGNYLANLFNLMQYSRKKLLALHGEKVTADNMYRNFADVTKKEPVFFYKSNIVCIPHGLIKKVSKELPGYIIWARVGFSLAKIIGYSFDSIGMQYKVKLQGDAQETYNNFVNTTRDTITLSNPILFGTRTFSFELNNALSQNERIAENTALRLLEKSITSALDEEKLLPWVSEKFNGMKTFLVAVTQEFCQRMTLMEFTIQAMESSILPPQFRIENILSNSERFSDEFSCKQGSGMTRMNSESVFPYLENTSLD